MIAGEDIPDIPEYIELSSIRVHAPSLVVFMCGGKIEENLNQPPTSLRDAFMRVFSKSPLAKYEIVFGEDPSIFPPIGEYTELLKFETDVAQLTELLMLFSESAGSFVELGMFVVDEEVSPKLLVIIDDKNHNSNSFIKYGPIYTLIKKYEEAAVCVLPLADLKIKSVWNLKGLDSQRLLGLLEKPLKDRLGRKREPRTFDKARHGHVTKLITGLIQHYAALTLDEIDLLLFCLNILSTREEIKRHLQCAEKVGWIITKHVGTDLYCAARAIAKLNAIDFELQPGNPIKNKTRWRTDIRDYWKKNDQVRFSIISTAMTS